MLTRRHAAPVYDSPGPGRLVMNGAVRISQHKGITQTWAVARPVSAPTAAGAPFYLTAPANQHPPGNALIRGGNVSLSLPVNRVEMDPSDSSTWQRPYRFTR